MKAYSIKKIGNISFFITFRVSRINQWHDIFTQLKTDIKLKFSHHIKNSDFHKIGFGLLSDSSEYDIFKKIEGRKIKIGKFKIKKASTYNKNIYFQNKFYRKDYYVSFFITIIPYSEKLSSTLNYSNPRVRNVIFDFIKSSYKPEVILE